MPRELLLGNSRRGSIAIPFAEDGVHRVHNFRAPAIIQRHAKHHTFVPRRLLHGFAHVFLHGSGQFLDASQKAHANLVFLKKWHFFLQVFAQKLH